MSEITVKTIKVPEGDPKHTQGPYIRAVVDGQGCSLPECNCSPENFILISNGEIALSVALTDEQARLITDSGGLDTSEG